MAQTPIKQKLELKLTIDLDGIRDAIKDSAKLEDRALYEKLSEIDHAKQAIKAVEEEVDAVDKEAKKLIDIKAKEVHGPNWEAIKGDGFKIGRQLSGGSVYIIDPNSADKRYQTVKVTPNTDAINGYREEHEDKLPEGVKENENRNYRVTIKASK